MDRTKEYYPSLDMAINFIIKESLNALTMYENQVELGRGRGVGLWELGRSQSTNTFAESCISNQQGQGGKAIKEEKKDFEKRGCRKFIGWSNWVHGKGAVPVLQCQEEGELWLLEEETSAFANRQGQSAFRTGFAKLD